MAEQSTPPAESADGAADKVPSPGLGQQVEALLLTADRPLTSSRLSMTLDAATDAIDDLIEQLNDDYASTGRVMRIHRVAGGWRLETTPLVTEVLHEAQARRSQHKLSQAALETLAVIAYRQPVMRAEVEAIRGVACGEVLRGLMERRLVRIAGRAEELGRPILYGTTRDFLRIFGLGGLDDLPEVEGLVRGGTTRLSKVTSDDAAQAVDSTALTDADRSAEVS